MENGKWKIDESYVIPSLTFAAVIDRGRVIRRLWRRPLFPPVDRVVPPVLELSQEVGACLRHVVADGLLVEADAGRGVGLDAERRGRGWARLELRGWRLVVPDHPRAALHAVVRGQAGISRGPVKQCLNWKSIDSFGTLKGWGRYWLLVVPWENLYNYGSICWFGKDMQ